MPTDQPQEPETLVRDVDREFFERELASFVPHRVYDAHCHLWSERGIGARVEGFPKAMDYQLYKKWIDQLHPDRDVSALFLPTFNDPKDIHANSYWISRQIKQDLTCRGLFRFAPDDDPEWVREQGKAHGLHGLKCYHIHAKNVRHTFNADIPDYLPEAHVKMAHEEGWVIMLHMVKARAVADPSNIYWIRHYCKTYPNIKLILAHSARGFNPSHNFEGLPQLTGLDNLYFDTSANCEPKAHEAIIRIVGHEKLMYGSDFFVSHLRGRSVAAADSFVWLYEGSPVWGEKHLTIEPVFIGLEHLRSVKWACWSARLSDSQVEDIFFNNAAQCFGVK